MSPQMGLSWLYTQLGSCWTGVSTCSSISVGMMSSSLSAGGGRSVMDRSDGPQCNSPKTTLPSSSSTLRFIPILNLKEGRTFLQPFAPPPSSASSTADAAVKSLSLYLQEDEGMEDTVNNDDDEVVGGTDDNSHFSPFSLSSPFGVDPSESPRHQHHPGGASTLAPSSSSSISAPIIAWIGATTTTTLIVDDKITADHHHHIHITAKNMVPYLVAEGAYTGRMRQFGTYTYNVVKNNKVDTDRSVKMGCEGETTIDEGTDCPTPSTCPLPINTAHTSTAPCTSYTPIPLDEVSMSSLHLPQQQSSPTSSSSAGNHGNHSCFPFELPVRREQRQQQKGRRGRHGKGPSPHTPLPSPPQYHLHFGRVLREKEMCGVEAASSSTGAAHRQQPQSIRPHEVAVIPLSPEEVLELLDSLHRQEFQSDTPNIVTASSSPPRITIPSIVDVRGSLCLPVFCVRKEDTYGVIGSAL